MKNKKRVITMRTLGTKGHGRFGNQVLQYGFLKIYASRYSLKVKTHPWIGQYLFGHQDPPVTRKYPILTSSDISKIKTNKLLGSKNPPFVNVDLQGQFMMHANRYKPYKKLFRSLFQPTPGIYDQVNKGMLELRKRGKTVVGLHVRRGDFLNYKNHPRNFPVPTSWYIKWLKQIWPTLENPVLFIASDDLDSVLSKFKRYRPVTSSDVIENFPKKPKYHRLNPSFYPDFYILTQCDHLAISNSTFSFAASLLNKRCKSFMRPHMKRKLVPFQPWNSKRRLNLLRSR
ncbi:alpha-1,2-fucosyltransferase [Paenibacillus prosopidis]|uniref:Glycosyl transferase family 11 n=1 Tax=Paenibacillus prosopidis TaxID=630520 RepID=A0A368VSR3_9BACL|nr:alpha-1,2-fucosyltransferase [Paenibacillus prosopidis]RCW43016.1 glycosyl transferase family 11 [Paenibacillus prosopidis]